MSLTTLMSIAAGRKAAVGLVGLATLASVGVGLSSTIGANASTGGDVTLESSLQCGCGGGGNCPCPTDKPCPCPTDGGCPTNGPCPMPTHIPTPAPTSPTNRPTTPAPAPTTSGAPAPAGNLHDGTYVGAGEKTRYGNVKVQLKVSDGRITQARAVGFGGGRTQAAGTLLKKYAEEAVAAQSATIQPVSGDEVLYSAYVKSLESAIAKSQSGHRPDDSQVDTLDDALTDH